MSDNDDPTYDLTGQCLCGRVVITLTDGKSGIDVCHCDMCRKWGGSFFGGIQAKSFAIEGENLVGIYRSSEWAERAFCTNCGSNLYFKFLPSDHYSFLAGLFELPDEFQIEEQIFYDQKPQWFDLAQDTRRKTGAEVIEEAKAAGYDFD